MEDALTSHLGFHIGLDVDERVEDVVSRNKKRLGLLAGQSVKATKAGSFKCRKRSFCSCCFFAEYGQEFVAMLTFVQ